MALTAGTMTTTAGRPLAAGSGNISIGTGTDESIDYPGKSDAEAKGGDSPSPGTAGEDGGHTRSLHWAGVLGCQGGDEHGHGSPRE